jgi:hypothetical protein
VSISPRRLIDGCSKFKPCFVLDSGLLQTWKVSESSGNPNWSGKGREFDQLIL